MIELQNIKDLSQEDIVKLLLEWQEQPFEIYIPKYTQQFFSESLAIAIDYSKLAYCGQRLSEVSAKFTYEEVPPSLHESVLFEIQTDNIKELAEVLFQISYGYENGDEEDEFSFMEEVEEFLDKVENAKIVPFCSYFVTVYKEFLPEEEE